ncbi:Pls/PosA family non-ribosomal peptide synthetase [Streptomyces sp. NPDC006326]|uniref:Pls/PosA family non-ribosomal peptide synthetase n=1 Tax=Streptomyces sp. NPDC006326 TaxID=3156752 RepID=UPI0033AB362D
MEEESVEVLTPGPELLTERGNTDPAEDIERVFAEVLADVIGVDRVSADSHFFNDLGANSMVMAQFCARVRKRPDLPSISIKDIYREPTVRGLAASVAGALAAPAEQPPLPPEAPTRTTTARYVLCGVVQCLVFLGYCLVAGALTTRGYEWVSAAPGTGLPSVYLRSLVFGGSLFVALCVLPIAAKWILVGRWEPREFPVWSLAYLRLWTVRVLIQMSPMALLVGNPLHVLYLRALGARIGPGVTILTRTIPVCTDLLTIGAGTVIRKESNLLCYRAHAGRIQTGRVTLGRDVFVGEKTVLDIDTAMGDGSQLGHSSALLPGQSVPAGARWHGAPAQPADVDYVRVPPRPCSTLRRVGYGLAALLQLLVLYVPLAVGGLCVALREVPALGRAMAPGRLGISSPMLYLDAFVLATVVFFGGVVLGLSVLYTVPRLLSRLIEPDRVYPLYGFHYGIHRLITRMTNLRFFRWLCGDSSYIVPYLRGLGYDLSKVVQTGSNFGTEVQHETPFLIKVGSGTMVADGLSVLNAEFSGSSFRVTRVQIGARNFLGNNIAYPAGGRTGENCLLATKVMVPLDGEIREGVGLLGSPCFEIPRTVERDTRFDHLRSDGELERNLRAKNRYNRHTMALFLGVRWLHVFLFSLISLLTADLYEVLGAVALAAMLPVGLLVTTLYYVLVERSFTAWRPLRPQLCSIYDPAFWRHELLWKMPDHHLLAFNGTPFKPLVWRLLGVRIGRRVFDDGFSVTERTLGSVGDDCTLNFGSRMQCHSQEDGTFKSDRSTLGPGCTLGVNSHVHYGVTMGEGSFLAADSFLMKGEDVPAGARWGGNPATETRENPHRPEACRAAARHR